MKTDLQLQQTSGDNQLLQSCLISQETSWLSAYVCGHTQPKYTIINGNTTVHSLTASIPKAGAGLRFSHRAVLLCGHFHT